VASIGSQAQDCRIEIDIPQQGTDAFCDLEVVRRILNNLISNAVKYVPKRNGVIRISTVDREEDGFVTVCVADNGQGIPPNYQTSIFEMFGQVEASQNRERRSSGLGLTFCKLAVEAHGGTIGVQSREGQGSLFWFRLPRTQVGFPHEEVIQKPAPEEVLDCQAMSQMEGSLS
jgi:signal transduction histidine kinase